ncbi:MAG TPA: nuclear transport factor 2 family protein [Candidatus Limnocylindrales bacterium]|nr:nuclear transport factor 2 family protein [Candidatus Limnocylindrales bacterium]
MRLTLMVALCALGLPLFSNGPKASKPDTERATQELLQLENQWLKARADAGAQEHILAADFVHALPSGFITKKDQIDFLRRHQAPAEDLTRHFEDLKVRIYGTAGVVNGIVVAADHSGAEVRKTVFTDVFAYRNGRWQAVNAQENDFKASGR